MVSGLDKEPYDTVMKGLFLHQGLLGEPGRLDLDSGLVGRGWRLGRMLLAVASCHTLRVQVAKSVSTNCGPLKGL